MAKVTDSVAHSLLDLTGKIFGELTVVSRAGSDRLARNSTWLCRCSCGVSGLIVSAPNLKRPDRHPSCGCILRKRYEANAETALINRVMCTYSCGARKRGRVFELNFEQMRQLIKAPCFFCGRTGSNTKRSKFGTLHYNGIDRDDNTKGYTMSNCLTACGPCNRAKGERTAHQFIADNRRIAAHTGSIVLSESEGTAA